MQNLKDIIEQIESLENPFHIRWQHDQYDIYEDAKEAAADLLRGYLEKEALQCIRRAIPSLIASDIVGVSPMVGPKILISEMKKAKIVEGDTIQINNDKWDDLNKKYIVYKAIYSEDTTGVKMTLGCDGSIVHRTIPINQIIKVN